MQDYTVYVETLRTPKKGGAAYWDRKPMESAFVYKSLPGDVTNRFKNVVRQVSDSERIIIIFNKHENTSNSIKQDDSISNKPINEAAESLCSVINAILEIKGTVINNVKVVKNTFKVTYTLKGKEYIVTQPLS